MKKTISILIALSMTLSLFAHAAVGESRAVDSTELQSVLKSVKSKIEIPPELDNFRYDMSDSAAGRVWNFYWNNDKNGSISVSADDFGRILSLYKYSPEHYTTTAPELTKAEAKEKAKEHLKKVAPEVYNNVSDMTDDYQYISNNAYQFTFYREHNDTPSNNYYARMLVRYDTGELVEYNLNWDFNLKYPNPKAPISEDKALNIWADALEMKLMYNVVTPVDENETPKAFLAYSPLSTLNAIDAETGELIEENIEWISRENSKSKNALAKTSEAGGMDEDTMYSGLTDAEVKKAAELNGLISVSTADKAVRALPNLVLDSSYRIASSRLFRQQNYYTRIRTDKNDKYVWEITYSGPVTKGDLQPSTIYTQVDAKTAELISYNVYIPNENETGAKRAVNKEQAKALAEQLATAAAPDKFSNTKYSESDGEVVRPLDDGQNEEPVYSYFNYSRTYEDIEFNSNYIQMGVNTIIGKVTSFSYYWMDDVEFESPEGVIDIEQAKNAYLSQGKVVLGYNIITSYLYDKESSKDDMAVSSARKISMVYPNVVDREYRAVLAYNFIPISGMISAKTAKPLDYMGKEIEDDEELDGYTDIADNRRQREITLMYDAGVLPKGKEFRPDDIVSQKDYLAFMLVVLNSRYQPLDAQTDLENLYKLAEDLGIIEKSERDPDKELNRFETMKYLVRALGFGKLSQDASLFNVTFKDAKSIPRTYYGTVALASHFSLTDPNASSFNGAEKVTRAEAAMQIYRLMKAIKNK